MGRDKAQIQFNGEPMWRRQYRVLRRAGASPVVVVRRDGQSALGKDIPEVRDVFPGAGPLAGLQAALVAMETRWLAVLAVDMPAIDAGWFRWLSEFCGVESGAVVRHEDGFEPLAAIYPRAALATVARRLRRGALSMQELIAALVRADRMTVVSLSETERWRVENWNRPQDRRPARPRGEKIRAQRTPGQKNFSWNRGKPG